MAFQFIAIKFNIATFLCSYYIQMDVSFKNTNFSYILRIFCSLTILKIMDLFSVQIKRHDYEGKTTIKQSVILFIYSNILFYGN